MTKKDSTTQRRRNDLMSQSVVCLPATGVAERSGRGASLSAREVQDSLESCSMIALSDRVESWLRLTDSGAGDSGDVQTQRYVAPRQRPVRHRTRPAWNNSTSLPAKPRTVSMLPTLPVHGLDCSCVGCELIKTSRQSEAKKNIASGSAKHLALPSIAKKGAQSKKHARSSTFPSTSGDHHNQWALAAKQTGAYTRSQIVATDHSDVHDFPLRNLLGASEPQLTRSMGPITDRQAELLSWAADVKEAGTGGGGGGSGGGGGVPLPHTRVRRQQPVFQRPSNRPLTVQKPLAGTRLPKLDAPGLPPLGEERPIAMMQRGQQPAAGNDELVGVKSVGDDIIDDLGVQATQVEYDIGVAKATPSVCLRSERVTLQQPEAGMDVDVTEQPEAGMDVDVTEQPEAGMDVDVTEQITPDVCDTSSVDSFHSDSLANHGLDYHSDSDCNSDDHFDFPHHDNATSTKQATAYNYKDELLQSFYNNDDEGHMSGSPPSRHRERELDELTKFAQWAERFGGGLKGLSIASLMQDCHEARQDGHHCVTQSTKQQDTSDRTACRPSLVAMVAAQNVERKLSQRQDQQLKVREIERIRRELLAMRQRHALQQQEAAIEQEMKRSMLFQAVGGPTGVTETGMQPSDNVSVDASISLDSQASQHN